MIVRIPAKCLANRNIIFRLYRFSFHKPIKSRLVRGRLYLPFTPYKSTTESATLRQLNSGNFKIFNASDQLICDLTKLLCTLINLLEGIHNHLCLIVSFFCAGNVILCDSREILHCLKHFVARAGKIFRTVLDLADALHGIADLGDDFLHNFLCL